MAELWKSSNYIVDDIYTTGRIVEYDLRAANINVLRLLDLIDDEYYNYTTSLPKKDREVEIGLLIKSKSIEDKDFYKKLANGITEARHVLMDYNNIDDSEIVRIANDAVYVNRMQDLKYTKFNDYLEFRQKSISNSMLRLDTSLLIFISYIDSNIDIDVKGISSDKIIYHQNYMLNFIGNLMYYIERVNLKDAINIYKNFYIQYVSRQLPIEFYRELNATSCYNVNNMYLSEISNGSLGILDINYNLLILRRLWKIILELYMRGNKK